ncbi:Protein-glutamate methylesterase/protein-glutamine glutaminase 2 [Gammaproteobacteria bacterium]
MPVRALVVDDSGFFRRRLTEILTADPMIRVVGSAANGREAVDQVLALQPDVVTMDVEMPVMDGIAAVREIMRRRPTPILMFSSLTSEGAKSTLDALDAGAMDFLPKRFEDIATEREQALNELRQRVCLLGRRGVRQPAVQRPAVQPPPPLKLLQPATSPTPHATPHPAPHRARRDYRLVVIGTSTGGPVALQEILTRLPASFPLPLLLIQHMPATFTPTFAARLDQLCQVRVREAQDGDILTRGTALLAPGGKQMFLDDRGTRVLVRDSDPNLHYRPSVDVTFSSAARAFPGQVLALILTGMGSDGREGARLLKQGNSTVWAQNEASCVVYGMPMAVVEAGLADQVLPLSDLGPALAAGV